MPLPTTKCISLCSLFGSVRGRVLSWSSSFRIQLVVKWTVSLKWIQPILLLAIPYWIQLIALLAVFYVVDTAAFTTGHILDTANFATNYIRILKLKFETLPQTDPH